MLSPGTSIRKRSRAGLLAFPLPGASGVQNAGSHAIGDGVRQLTEAITGTGGDFDRASLLLIGARPPVAGAAPWILTCASCLLHLGHPRVEVPPDGVPHDLPCQPSSRRVVRDGLRARVPAEARASPDLCPDRHDRSARTFGARDPETRSLDRE